MGIKLHLPLTLRIILPWQSNDASSILMIMWWKEKQWHLISDSGAWYLRACISLIFWYTNWEFCLKWHQISRDLQFPNCWGGNATCSHLHINLYSTRSQAYVMMVIVGPLTCDVDGSVPWNECCSKVYLQQSTGLQYKIFKFTSHPVHSNQTDGP